MSTIAITPASGHITATKTVCRVDLSGFAANTATGYNTANYPSEPAVTYYITFELGGVEKGRSYVFGVNGGAHQFNNYIFPTAGSWTVRVKNAGTNASVTSITVVVA